MEKDFGYLIKNINDKMKAKADADLKHFDITFAQSQVIAILSAKGGKATQKEIELFLEVSHPTVAGIVSRMEQKGYVVTWIDENDKRNKIVKLTQKAEEMGKDLEQKMRNNEKNLLKSLTREEIGELTRLLGVIYKNLE
ncbi:MAG: MarR family winged helix-turn-helix transcriptional regulator [Christensenellales bacterium]